ncbi:MAG: hypothetical protein WA175_02390 [Candidatus Acidiferrales bacterium]
MKHGLDAFERLPNFIWNTGEGPRHVPHRYKEVREGDRWIGFAYTTSDSHERPLSLVTGFFECEKEYSYGPVPAAVSETPAPSPLPRRAWLIEGSPFGPQPKKPVVVPPIRDLLKKRVWNNQAITPIKLKDFEQIQKYALKRQFDPRLIPLLGREPYNEQELLAIAVSAHKNLGIEKIIRVRTAFPDLLVKLVGRKEAIHIELEIYSTSFFAHGHGQCVYDHLCKEDERPVAVLCWIDDDRKKRLKHYVHRVFELRSLIRQGRQLRW